MKPRVSHVSCFGEGNKAIFFLSKLFAPLKPLSLQLVGWV